MTTIDAHPHIVPPAVAEAVGTGNWHGIRFDPTAEGKVRGTCEDEQAVLPWPDFVQSLDERVALTDAERIDVHLPSRSPSICWCHSPVVGRRDPIAWLEVNDRIPSEQCRLIDGANLAWTLQR